MPSFPTTASSKFFVGLCLTTFLTWLQSACLGADGKDENRLQYQMVEEPNRLQFSPLLMRERSDALLEYAIAHEDCDSLHLATFLAMQADVVMDVPHDPSPFQLPWACPWRHGPLFYVRGVLDFNAGDYDAAAADFKSASAAAALNEAVDQQIFALHALGSVEINRRNHHEALAVFEKAYALDPDFHLPTHLNNLAFASYILGDCSAAIRWCDLATEQLDKRSKEMAEAYFVGDRNVILVTRLLVALAQNDVLSMESIIGQINFQNPFAGRELVAVSAVTQALQNTNRPRAFEALRPTFASWLGELDSLGIAREFGANRHLFAPWHPAGEPITAATWNELCDFPMALRGLAEISCNDSADEVAVSGLGLWTVETWKRLTMGAILFVVVAVWFVIRQFRFARALRATFDAVPAAQRAILNQALHLPSSRRSLLRGRTLIALRMLRHEQEMASIDGDLGLSGQQRLALVRLRAGLPADVVARETGLSRRAVKGLQNMKSGAQVVALVMAMVVSAPVTASDLLPADSAWQWLQRGDSAAWFAAIDAGVTLMSDEGLPHAVACAFLPWDERPAWARTSDGQTWAELRHAAVVLDDERLFLTGQMSTALNPEVHAAFWERERSRDWRNRFTWATVSFAFCSVLGGALFARNRSLLQGVPSDAVALDAAWGRGEAALAGAFAQDFPLTDAKDVLSSDDKWNLLNGSEQEVAIYLAEGLSAGTIADRMSCTSRYIYNIRSTIRKKWDLDGEEDLITAIRTHQPQN